MRASSDAGVHVGTAENNPFIDSNPSHARDRRRRRDVGLMHAGVHRQSQVFRARVRGSSFKHGWNRTTRE